MQQEFSWMVMMRPKSQQMIFFFYTWNIAFYNYSAPTVRNSGVIPIPAQILEDGNLSMRKKASGVIAVLSYIKGDRDALADAGAIPSIADKMYDELDEMLDLHGNGTEALLHIYEDPNHKGKAIKAADPWSYRVF